MRPALAAAVIALSAPASARPLTIALLGDSRTDGCVGAQSIDDCRKNDVGFNRPVLGGLLRHAARHHPAAVFFTGDLTLGYEREAEDGVVDPGAQPASGGWAR